MAFTFLAAQGKKVGRPYWKKTRLKWRPRYWLGEAAGYPTAVPVDVVVAPELAESAPAKVVAADAIPADQMGLISGRKPVNCTPILSLGQNRSLERAHWSV